MPVLIATGVFCPVEGIAEGLIAAGWQVVSPDGLARVSSSDGPIIGIVEGTVDALPEILAANPSLRAVVLHASRAEALATALCEGIEPDTALER